MARQVRKQRRRPHAALAVSLERERRFQQGSDRIVEKARGGVESLELLSVRLFQPGLVVPRVDVTGATVHEQPDDRFGPRAELRRARRQWIGCKFRLVGAPLRTQDRIKREHAQSAAGKLQKLAARTDRRQSSTAIAHGLDTPCKVSPRAQPGSFRLRTSWTNRCR